MNILLLGYGKMGKVIEQVALGRGHTIPHKINIENLDELSQVKPETIDVAIEFSTPESAVPNLMYCFEHQIPVVCGTTGWLHRKTELEMLCMQKGSAFFYASNYSLGVNIFFHLNHVLANLMNRYSTYEVSMEEIHHTEKKDTPSGTALTLAKDIIDKLERKTNWVNTQAIEPSQLSIISKREANIPGTHTIRYDSQVDSIEIKHTAHNREGFALGAVVAAEWLQGKQGVFGMQDMMEF
jgi:4-hydroxy-tetrahydrodipicolinate reductase